MLELQRLVDETLEALHVPEIDWESGREMIRNLRRKVLLLFPGQGDLFDLIYQSRFNRVLDEKMNLM